MSAPGGKAPAFPPARRVEANGIRLAVHEAGERRGLPVVLLHGFPELAYSWRHVLPALAEAGRWAVAPDQRGYGGSDKPHAIEAYGMEALTGDMIGLLDALGAPQAIWVGHDWGGLVGWELARRFPERTAGVVGLNTPYLPRTEKDPVTTLRERFGPAHYINVFQTPRLPELLFEADVRRSFRVVMRRTGGDRPKPSVLQTASELFRPKAEHQLLSEAELEVYAEAFRRGGFRGPINWYRNLRADWERSAELADHVSAPALMITAEFDPFLPPELAEGMERYVPDLEPHRVRGSGHWTQQEQPEAVNRILLSWLGRRFPLGGAGESP